MESKEAVGEDPTIEEGAQLTLDEARNISLAYVERHDAKVAAIRRERQLKGWTREKKEALVRGDLIRLRALSKRRR